MLHQIIIPLHSAGPNAFERSGMLYVMFLQFSDNFFKQAKYLSFPSLDFEFVHMEYLN